MLVTCTGGDIGPLIGKHGQTIDALQYVANAAAAPRAATAKPVTVDAAGLSRTAPLDARGDRAARRRSCARRRARLARADDGGRAEGRARTAEGCRRRADRERGDGAESVRRRPPRLTPGSRRVRRDTRADVASRPAEARRVLLDDSLRGVPAGRAVRRADRRRRLAAAARPASRSRIALPGARGGAARGGAAEVRLPRGVAPPNARVVWGRAEEQATDWAGVAVAKALAQPPTAAEWCLPLVRPGGAVVLWVGPSAEPRPRRPRRGPDRRRARRVRPPGFLVIRKTGPTPPGFPRRRGVAKKRPLA